MRTARGQAEGYYRGLNRNVVSHTADDNREPLRNAEVDTVATLDGRWHLFFREVKPKFVGVLPEDIGFLNPHKTNFTHRSGGLGSSVRRFLIAILSIRSATRAELKRVFDRWKSNTNKMDKKRTMDRGVLPNVRVSAGKSYRRGTVDGREHYPQRLLERRRSRRDGRRSRLLIASLRKLWRTTRHSTDCRSSRVRAGRTPRIPITTASRMP